MTLLPLLVLALSLRLYQLSTPLADWHSFRQADTASVAREYIKHGVDLLRPRYHDLSNIQSGQDNPQGYRMVEFPAIPALVALTYPRFLPLHIYYRLIDIFFSLGSLTLLYFLTKTLFNPSVARLSALIFAVLPYNIFYSRAVLPEIPLVFFSLLTMYFFIKYVDKPTISYWLVASGSAAIALLLKPTAIFFFPPLLVYLYQKRGLKGFCDWRLYLGFILSFIPLLLWRQWLAQFPAGIPVAEWLLNSNGIRLRPAWFRWLFYERFTKLILGYAGLLPFVIGCLSVICNLRSKILLTWMLSSLAYLIIIATGNVQHDYYQIILIPLVCILLALGLNHLWYLKNNVLKIVSLISYLISLVISWHLISGYYHINHWEIVEAGQAVDELTPHDALVIAPYMGDTAFLYQTNRRGWPIGNSIEDKINKGAQYYVSVNYDDEARALEQKYTVITQTPKYILMDLQVTK